MVVVLLLSALTAVSSSMGVGDWFLIEPCCNWATMGSPILWGNSKACSICVEDLHRVWSSVRSHLGLLSSIGAGVCDFQGR